MANENLNSDDEYISCQYCNGTMKQKNLEKHLKNKCKIYKTPIARLKEISPSKKIEEIDMSEMKDFDRLEELYVILLLDEDRLSIVKYQQYKNDIKRLESYFLEEEILKIKRKAQTQAKVKCLELNIKTKTLTSKINSLNNLVTCEHCKVALNKKNYEKHLKKCPKNKNLIPVKKVIHQKDKPISKEKFWETHTSIREIEEEKTTLTNIEKHQAIKYQFREDEELDPDLIDEEAYQKTFGTQLDDKSQQLRDRVAFEHEKIYKQEEEDKSEIKIFLSKMYKGYCQVCGYTFKKTNGVNSFERFNWNDKRVVKVKKSLVSTADSLCLCRNCSANIKWGAFYPNFVDTIREIEEFRDKSYDEVKDKIHKVVDENIPKIFEPLLEFDDIYALEIALDGKPRNIYFTNEHLLQFITYLQKEEEVEEEVEVKKKRNREKDAINSIYSANSWLKREETIPLDLAESFIRTTANWNHPTANRYVSAPKHADNIYKNSQHGWAVDFGSNSFLVGKAIERCKNSINEYIENAH